MAATRCFSLMMGLREQRKGADAPAGSPASILFRGEGQQVGGGSGLVAAEGFLTWEIAGAALGAAAADQLRRLGVQGKPALDGGNALLFTHDGSPRTAERCRCAGGIARKHTIPWRGPASRRRFRA